MASNLELLPIEPETKELLRQIAKVLEPKRQELISSWIKLFKDSSPAAAKPSEKYILSFIERLINLFIDEVQVGDFNNFFEGIEEGGKEMVKSGLPYEELILAIHQYETATLPFLVEAFGYGAELLEALEALDHLYHNALAIISSSYFMEKNRQLEEESRRREQFISVVSHEFRGPLTIISGFAQMMMLTLPKESSERQKLETILNQSRNMSRLVDDLQDVTRIQTGHFDIEKEPSDLIEIVRDVVAAQQHTTDKHHIVLDVKVPALECNIDPQRIAQALTNLIGNAIKYSPDGGEIDVKVEQKGSSAVVSVTDHGTGITPEDMSHLFEPFARLRRPPGVKGSGLGLFITKGIIEAHGGRIWAESEPGKGTTFTFELPL